MDLHWSLNVGEIFRFISKVSSILTTHPVSLHLRPYNPIIILPAHDSGQEVLKADWCTYAGSNCQPGP